MIKYSSISFTTNSLAAIIPVGNGLAGSPKAWVSLRRAGDMAVIENGENPRRKALFSHLGLERYSVLTLKQDHSKKVYSINEETKIPKEGDGLITSISNILLGVTVADCLPIYLYAERSKVIGILHSGWKGTGITGEAVKLMKERYRCSPEEIFITIGPGIGVCCYSVPEERAESFARNWGEETVKYKGGVYYLDMVKANLKILSQNDINNITVIRDCTCCNEYLGSFRREGHKS